MMRKFFILITLLATSVLTFGQEDDKAKEILKIVSEKISSYSTISMDFSSSMENIDAEINEKNEGFVKIKGEKYVADIYEVHNSTKRLILKRYSDGKTLWNYMPDGNQVIISDMDDEENDLMNPTSLFNIYDKGFKSKFIKESNEATLKIYNIDLYPTEDEFDISKISLKVNKATMMIHSFTLYETTGSFYNIKVKNFEANKTYLESEFIFDSNQFKDIEEIDMR